MPPAGGKPGRGTDGHWQRSSSRRWNGETKLAAKPVKNPAAEGTGSSHRIAQPLDEGSTSIRPKAAASVRRAPTPLSWPNPFRFTESKKIHLVGFLLERR